MLAPGNKKEDSDAVASCPGGRLSLAGSWMPTAVLTKPGINDGIGILREVPGYGVISTYSYTI